MKLLLVEMKHHQSIVPEAKDRFEYIFRGTDREANKAEAMSYTSEEDLGLKVGEMYSFNVTQTE